MATFNGLSQNPVYHKLNELAKEPFDLTMAGALNKKRISSYHAQTAGYSLLYGTQRLNHDVLTALQQLADDSQLVTQFLQMKKGEVINKIDGYESEHRQVLHTCVRDVFTGKPLHRDSAQQAKTELAKLQNFLEDLTRCTISTPDGGQFTDMILIGIGGSDLGPRALYMALNAYCLPDKRIHFISNVDPDDAAMVLRGINLKNTLVNVVSKSGTTLETLSNEELVRNAYTKSGLDPAKHFIAVTGKNSPMDNPDKYLQSFHMFDYIGGRYSATSMVGAVILSFALGYDAFIELLKGANSVDIAAEETDIRKNIPLLMALIGIWNNNFLGHQTLAILPYSQALVRFTAHLQQCDMESNGKSIDRQGRQLSYNSGPIIWGEPGTNGQHAFYQLIHQGTTTVPVEFIGFRKSQYGEDLTIKNTTSQEKLIANLLAQSIALATGREHQNPNRRFAGNRPNSVLIADQLTPFSMGALLAIYETKIAFQGFLWNINSFDQEGVQLGKVLANQLLDNLVESHTTDNTISKNDDTGKLMLKAAGII